MNRRSFLGGLAAAAAGCQTAPDPADSTLRVLTYNTHHGEGVDGRLDLERIARVIRDARADLVALQEVDRRAHRTGGIDQSAEYLRRTGRSGWYGAAMPFQGGEYGQVLLSRWPLAEPRVIRLPGTPGREPRIAVTAVVEPPGWGRLRWTGLHFDASRADEDRWEQAGALLRELSGEAIPQLAAGDFNDPPESRVLQRFLGAGGAWEDTAGAAGAPTVPAEAPRSRIDFVLAAPRGRWRAVESVVIAEAVASD
ncbi:MAG: endonuclease/exonuclease/phosphatase family protein, partial [Verrucomicrobiota bacterium]